MEFGTRVQVREISAGVALRGVVLGESHITPGILIVRADDPAIGIVRIARHDLCEVPGGTP
jgi:hypothetical protein